MLDGGGASAAGGCATTSAGDPITRLCRTVDRQLYVLVEWARLVPGFVDLPLEDQRLLLRSGVLLFCSSCFLLPSLTLKLHNFADEMHALYECTHDLSHSFLIWSYLEHYLWLLLAYSLIMQLYSLCGCGAAGLLFWLWGCGNAILFS